MEAMKKKCSGLSHFILLTFLCQSSGPAGLLLTVMSSPRLGGGRQNSVDRQGILGQVRQILYYFI